jgi:CBS domain-containing protein
MLQMRRPEFFPSLLAGRDYFIHHLRCAARHDPMMCFSGHNHRTKAPSGSGCQIRPTSNQIGATLLFEDSKVKKALVQGCDRLQGDDNDGTCNSRYQGSPNPERRSGGETFLRHQNPGRAQDRRRIEGILSERDIVRVLGERGAGALEEPVSAVMTRKVVSCKQSDTVAAIMEMMTLGKFRHLPVVDGERVVGLISIGDIVKWRVQEYEHEQEALREYIKTA